MSDNPNPAPQAPVRPEPEQDRARNWNEPSFAAPLAAAIVAAEDDKAKPNLGDPDVLWNLVLALPGNAQEAFTAYGEGKITGDELQAQLMAKANAFGDIIMGRDPSYASNGWFTPAALGQHILREYSFHGTPPDLSGARLAESLLADSLNNLIEAFEGRNSYEAAAEHAIADCEVAYGVLQGGTRNLD